LTEGGAPAEKLTFDGKCCYSEKTRQALDAERRLVTLTGAAYFSGDLAPDLETLQGYALVNGGSVKRLIHYAERGRNPDGTVNFTRLDLM
jgi:hypothetical protein